MNGESFHAATPQQWNEALSHHLDRQLSATEFPEFHFPTQHFTHNLVIRVQHLAEGLGLKPKTDELALERLRDSLFFRHKTFKRYVIWNARHQCLELCIGITTPDLRKHRDALKPVELEAFDAHMKNCFSMLNPDGTEPKIIDKHKFHMSFSPEFYPRRFILKDSLYEQRLDVLAVLLQYSRKRYASSDPPVEYIEYSLGAGDCCRPHVMDVFAAFDKDTQGKSSFYELFLKEQRAHRDSLQEHGLRLTSRRESVGHWLEEPQLDVVKNRAQLGLDDHTLPTFRFLFGIPRVVPNKYCDMCWHNPSRAVALFEDVIKAEQPAPCNDSDADNRSRNDTPTPASPRGGRSDGSGDGSASVASVSSSLTSLSVPVSVPHCISSIRTST